MDDGYCISYWYWVCLVLEMMIGGGGYWLFINEGFLRFVMDSFGLVWGVIGDFFVW